MEQKLILCSLILNSKCTIVQNRKASEGGGSITIRTEKNLGKKAIKDVIQEFKQYVKFCHNNNWKMPREILDFKFPQTFSKVMKLRSNGFQQKNK